MTEGPFYSILCIYWEEGPLSYLLHSGGEKMEDLFSFSGGEGVGWGFLGWSVITNKSYWLNQLAPSAALRHRRHNQILTFIHWWKGKGPPSATANKKDAVGLLMGPVPSRQCIINLALVLNL